MIESYPCFIGENPVGCDFDWPEPTGAPSPSFVSEQTEKAEFALSCADARMLTEQYKLGLAELFGPDCIVKVSAYVPRGQVVSCNKAAVVLIKPMANRGEFAVGSLDDAS